MLTREGSYVDTILKNRRVIRLIPFFLLLLILLCGCDPSFEKIPPDYPNSRWVCEDPHIEIVVGEHDRYTAAFIEDDGEERRFALDFLYGDRVGAYVNSQVAFSEETRLFRGYYRGTKDELTIILQDGKLWDDGYARLVFKRVE